MTFPTTGGIKAGGTDVKYRGVTVGHVTAVHLGKSLDHMKLRLRFEPDLAGHLGKGTQFWIAGRRVSFTNLASLKSVIAGPHIAIAPHDGGRVGHFTGLRHAPVVNPDKTGLTVTIAATRKGNLSRGAGIYDKGFRIGTVRAVSMTGDGRGFRIQAFIRRRYAHLVSTRSRFWNAGGVEVKTGGGGPRLQLQSISALASGALGLDTPQGGKAAAAGTKFVLYPSESAARDAPGPHAVPYRVVLNGGPRGLSAGAPVTLAGSRVGAVTKVGMAFDTTAGSLRTTVSLALDPQRIALTGATWNLNAPRPQMNALLSSLIGQGLRARLARATPVIGQRQLALVMVKGASPATLGSGAVPTIPAAPGSSIRQIMAEVSGVLGNLHKASARLAALSRAPQTRHTLEHLAKAASNLATITRSARGQTPHLLADLRRTANEADAALRAAHGLLAGTGSAASAPESQTLPRALYELTRAARSLREMTDQLQAHPNELILGRGR